MSRDLNANDGLGSHAAHPQLPQQSSQASPSCWGSGMSSDQQGGSGLPSCRSKRARPDGSEASVVNEAPPLVLMALPSPGPRDPMGVLCPENRGNSLGSGWDRLPGPGPKEQGDGHQGLSLLPAANSPSSGIGHGCGRGSGGSTTEGEEGPAHFSFSFQPVSLTTDSPARSKDLLRGRTNGLDCFVQLGGDRLLGGGLLGGGTSTGKCAPKSRLNGMTVDEPAVGHLGNDSSVVGVKNSGSSIHSGKGLSRPSALNRLASGPNSSACTGGSVRLVEAISQIESGLSAAPVAQLRTKQQIQGQSKLSLAPINPRSFDRQASAYSSKGFGMLPLRLSQR